MNKMPVIGLKETTKLRITPEVLEDIDRVVKKNADLFFSRSHFIRCACARLIREIDENAEAERIKRQARHFKIGL